jgi:hypothetical protein
MARYRVETTGGVYDTITMEIVTVMDYPKWMEYQAWLAAGNSPDPALTPAPLPVSAQRAEALARLDVEVTTRMDANRVAAVGHLWPMNPINVVVALVHRAAMPPVPGGFTLPDVSRAQVPLNSAQLSELVTAYSAKLVAFNLRFAALVAQIDASPDPLAVDITIGWPT